MQHLSKAYYRKVHHGCVTVTFLFSLIISCSIWKEISSRAFCMCSLQHSVECWRREGSVFIQGEIWATLLHELFHQAVWLNSLHSVCYPWLFPWLHSVCFSWFFYCIHSVCSMVLSCYATHGSFIGFIRHTAVTPVLSFQRLWSPSSVYWLFIFVVTDATLRAPRANTKPTLKSQ